MVPTPELTACLLSVFSALERPFVHPMEVAAELRRILSCLTWPRRWIATCDDSPLLLIEVRRPV